MMCNPIFGLPRLAGGVSFAVACVVALAPWTVYAQQAASESGQARTVLVEPRISVTETFTDNVRLSSTNRQSDLITQISPGIRISSQQGRIKGYFDYSISELFYANNSSPSRTQNALSTFATVEAVDNWAFVDFNGSISQQSVSAFGVPSSSNTSVNGNQTEVRNFRVSPYVRGQFGTVANYEARYSRSDTRNGSATASDVTTDEALVRVSGDSTFQPLGWSATASQQNIDYSAGRAIENDRLNVGLSYALTPQVSVSANVGREDNNYTSLDKKSYDTSGVGVVWRPSERTTFSASRDERSFGSAHNVSFEHRTSRTAWRFSDSKDVVTQPNQTGYASQGTVYDLLFSQFASIEPDLIARAQMVNAFLQTNGINPNAIAINTFLTSAVTLQRRQDLSFSLLGVRDTVTFLATRSENSKLDTVLSAIADDFSTSTLIRQRGFSINYSHRLTPNHSMAVLLSQQNISGNNGAQDTRLRSFNINLTGKIAKQVSASVGYRHVVYSSSSPYTENAIFGSLIVYF